MTGTISSSTNINTTLREREFKNIPVTAQCNFCKKDAMVKYFDGFLLCDTCKEKTLEEDADEVMTGCDNCYQEVRRGSMEWDVFEKLVCGECLKNAEMVNDWEDRGDD